MPFQGYAAVVVALAVQVVSLRVSAAEPVNVPAGTELADLKCAPWKAIDLAPFFPAGMERPFAQDVDQLTLEQFLQQFLQATGIAIGLDREELSAGGFRFEATISKRVKGLPASIALDLVLDEFSAPDLRWVTRRGRHLVTTSEKARQESRLAILEIGSLLEGGYSPETIQRLAVDLTSGPWRSIDGEGGHVKVLGDRLFVVSTDESIREIRVILTALASGEPVIDLYHIPADEKVRDALARPVTASLIDVPLAEAMESLSAQVGVIFECDESTLASSGVDTKTRVSLTVSDLPLSSVLEKLLDSFEGAELEAVILHGRLIVTTFEKSTRIQDVRLYDIPEIAERGETQALISLIQEMTSGPWREIDGDGGTMESLRPRTLLVRQTESGFAEIERLIAACRTGTVRPKAAFGPIEVRRFRVSTAMGKDLARVLPNFVAAGQWGELPDGTPASVECVALGADDAGDSILLIRHRKGVLNEIELFLHDLPKTPTLDPNALPAAPAPGFF